MAFQGTAPPDPQFFADMAAAQRRRDLSYANLAQQRTSGLSEYGFTEGAGGALTVDPNNPFSKAALLKQSYDRTRRASGQTMAAGGNLYAGSYQNTQDAINRNQLQAEDTLQKSLSRFLAQNTQGVGQAGTNFDFSAAAAGQGLLDRFPSNPNYQPSASQAAAATPTKATASLGRPQKTVSGKRYYQRASDGKWIPL